MDAYLYSGSRQSQTQDERGMVELIWEHQAPGTKHWGQIEHIGGKPHAKGDAILDTQKFWHQRL